MIDEADVLGASVLIAHEHRFVSHSLAEFLRSNNFEDVCEVDSPQHLDTETFDETPDLCIIGHSKDAGKFEQDCAIVRERFPEISLVLIDSNFSKERMQAAREQALDAYLSLRLTPELILDGLRLVLAGHECFPVQSAMDSKCATTGAISFTPREQDILRLVADGLANKVIARDLCISESTVKAHMNSVLRKIGVSNRTQVACWAVGHGYSDLKPTMAANAR